MKERIERLKKLTYIPQKEIAWLIEQAEQTVKQQEIIEENKRQQEVTVHQFRQAQKDIQHLSGDRKRYKQALEKIVTNLNFAITVAQNELEGAAE
ncbi:hypothetical protein [Bacillus velezensis]|uniref:hypothetical protein n=1 Tax=Bacillus velezensis TaxID=492670 RepID=UPI001EFC1E6F|nr:hypothetical protein [Bacillus velezensis]MCE4147407.1 hypothetical protein [Bacillus velezensis]ULN61952.1 hypothetical protein MID02_06035 [Bacillus velezensis]ULN62004.1 hypothetical protein MID02_06325 [Bacillus velezensis]